jgi:hypothetical protein
MRSERQAEMSGGPVLDQACSLRGCGYDDGRRGAAEGSRRGTPVCGDAETFGRRLRRRCVLVAVAENWGK